MTFELRFASRVEKDLRGFSVDIQHRLFSRLVRLAEDPFAAGTIKLQGEDAYRVRFGEYRIVFDVDAQTGTLTVLKVGHRSDIYR